MIKIKNQQAAEERRRLREERRRLRKEERKKAKREEAARVAREQQEREAAGAGMIKIKNQQDVLLSYPRSGNHLCRFFIELLSELPTYGCKGNRKSDIEIYKNEFDEYIPFNIKNKFEKNECYVKHHTIPSNKNTKNLILIIRNPREVLLRHCDDKLNINNNTSSYENYFRNIDYYNNHKGRKLLLYYEDMITYKKEFINKLYDFLSPNNLEKKNYVLKNIEKLFLLSANGIRNVKVNSNFQTHFYYKNISNLIKKDFDIYLNHKLKNYPFIREKYNI